MAPPAIYPLSLHDALPIFDVVLVVVDDENPRERSLLSGHRASRGTSAPRSPRPSAHRAWRGSCRTQDRKSTRLNSSHLVISYAVFCLKKKMYRKGSILNSM